MGANHSFRRAPWGRGWAGPRHTGPRPVWVDLAGLFPGLSTRSAVADGRPVPVLRLAGVVRGELHEWIRTDRGWMGLVHVRLDVSGGLIRLHLLVPQSALRIRDDGRTLAGTLDRRQDRH
jgi:hypothetical protein